MAEFQFSTYLIERKPGESSDSAMASVPNGELEKLLETANLALASVPANCIHPADGLSAFELISDCCVCGECGAVLKNYSVREALALGIEPGWRKMDAKLLEAEVYRAILPAVDLLEYLRTETSDFSPSGVRDIMGWGEATARKNNLLEKLMQAG